MSTAPVCCLCADAAAARPGNAAARSSRTDWDTDKSCCGWEKHFSRLIGNCKHELHGKGVFFATLLSSNPPIRAIEIVVNSDPRCLVMDFKAHRYRNSETETLLGMACRMSASLEAIRFIVREIWSRVSAKDKLRLKNSRRRKKKDEDPFFSFVEKGMFRSTGFGGPEMDNTILRVLLEEYPDGVMEDSRRGGYHTSHGECRAGQALMYSRNLNGRYWEKFRLVLMAYSLSTITETEGKEFLELHAFLEVVCTGTYLDDTQYCFRENERVQRVLQVLRLLKENVPSQFCKRDDKGRLPLHVFLSATPHFTDNGSIKGFQTGITKVVEFLLQEHPQSASACDRNGQLPLHLAAARDLTCAYMIADAEPRAIETRNPFQLCDGIKMQLYPFQIPLLHLQLRTNGRNNEDERKHSMELAYRLLRMSPTMAYGLAMKREPWMDSTEYKEIHLKKMKIAMLQGEINALEDKVEGMKQQSRACSIGSKRKRP